MLELSSWRVRERDREPYQEPHTPHVHRVTPIHIEKDFRCSVRNGHGDSFVLTANASFSKVTEVQRARPCQQQLRNMNRDTSDLFPRRRIGKFCVFEFGKE